MNESILPDGNLDQLKKDSEAGKAQAQLDLGVMYECGFGVEKDYAEAIKWYRKAAEQGGASAQYNLGVMLYKNQGRDFAKASQWLRKAAEQGHIEAQHLLGFMYANGSSVKKDYVEAVKWCRKAANQGHAEAQSLLEIMSADAQRIMNSDQRKFFKIGLAIFLIMALFPPWKEVVDTKELRWERGIGYAIIFETPRASENTPFFRLASVKIDYGRLAIGWIVDAILTASTILYLRQSSKLFETKNVWPP